MKDNVFISTVLPESPAPKKRRDRASVLIVALFLLISALPLYGMLIPSLMSDAGENRALTELSPLSEFSFDNLSDWFNDHFALRSDMIRLWNKMNVNFGVEAINGVAIGRDGWLYYMYDNSDMDIKRMSYLSQSALDDLCRNQQRNVDYLAERGTDYYLMICPDKHSVYPEYLPASLSGYRGPARLDGILNALSENTNVKYVDTRDAVIGAKDDHVVFLKTDTHWNAYGAYQGYDRIMTRIEQDYPTVRHVRYDECTFLEDPDWHEGDMAGFIGRSDELSESFYTIQVNDASSVLLDTPYRETVPGNKERVILRFEDPSHPERPSAVIFRDSFCKAMVPLFAESFSSVTLAWSTQMVEYILEYEKPDIVIMEFVERYAPQAANPMDTQKGWVRTRITGDPLPEKNDGIVYYIDSFTDDGETIAASGWAFDPSRGDEPGSVQLALKSGSRVFWLDTATVTRRDVTEAFAGQYGLDLDRSGWQTGFDRGDLPTGRWRLLIVCGADTDNARYIPTDRYITVIPEQK